MAKRIREFIDKDHKVIKDYYGLCDLYDGANADVLEPKLYNLIQKDRHFFDPYLLLHNILNQQKKYRDADFILDAAFKTAITIITDKKGNWPDLLEWEWLENRHIIKTIIEKSISLWTYSKNEEALDLLRNLLNSNPADNIGARYFILAIRKNMSYFSFEKQFDRGGYYDDELDKWFDKHYKKFPDDFSRWDREMEKYK